MTATVNREAWLTRAIPPLSKLLVEAGSPPIPEDIAVSCSWPGGGNRKRRVGECWPSKASKGRVQVFISPLLNDPHDVLGTLIHELIHAGDNCLHGHGKEFAQVARAVGLEGKPTNTAVGADLAIKLAAIADKLGDYPHNGMDPAGSVVKKQTTRMLKVQCEACGCIVRMTAKWLDEAGEPTCGCGGAMTFIPPSRKKAA